MLSKAQKNQVILIAEKIYAASDVSSTSKGHTVEYKKAFEQLAQNCIALAEIFFKESEAYRNEKEDSVS